MLLSLCMAQMIAFFPQRGKLVKDRKAAKAAQPSLLFKDCRRLPG
jgi:hypothetical protein